MALGLRDGLQALVKAKYNVAKTADALTFAPSQLEVPEIDRIPFQLRYCPGLSKKPSGATDGMKKLAKVDPFENPPQELLVASVPVHDSSHLVVLNKFPIIENHFILATKHNKLQTHHLEEDDLARTYECLVDWETKPSGARKKSRCFAFFNSGEHSGASQAHRHLQFLPVEDMAKGDEGGAWSLLVDNIMSGEEIQTASPRGFKFQPNLPFVHFGSPLPPKPSPAELRQIYKDLYDAAATKVREFVQAHPGELELHSGEDGRLPISYNLAMTTSAMVICPRRSEGLMIKREDGSDLGFVALNGTVLAGTLMVKNEELFRTLEENPEQLRVVLRSIGIPYSKAVRPQI